MLFENKTIFVTGGTGSFGHAFLPMFSKMTEEQQDVVIVVLKRVLS